MTSDGTVVPQGQHLAVAAADPGLIQPSMMNWISPKHQKLVTQERAMSTSAIRKGKYPWLKNMKIDEEQIGEICVQLKKLHRNENNWKYEETAYKMEKNIRKYFII